jgi:hypothetical protein
MSLRESCREVKFKYMLTQRHYVEEQLVASVPFPEAPPDPIINRRNRRMAISSSYGLSTHPQTRLLLVWSCQVIP